MTPDEIREIRKGLGLSQTEAGELLGGGPRAFTKYEAGSVKPAASVVNLLRLLDSHPEMIAPLKGDRSRPMTGLPRPRPFEVTGEHIAALTDRTFHLLLERLLIAEAWANDLPANGIPVAGNITAPDGGEDGRITWQGGPDRTRFLPCRLTQFQLKAGKVTPARAGNEIRTKRGEIKAMVRRALEVGGNYVLLCTHRYTQEAIEEREKRIRSALREVGLQIEDARVEFRDADQVATWVNSHPSVATWVIELTQPGTIGPFHSWTNWSSRGEYERSPWVEDERLGELRVFLFQRVREPQGIARVVGPSAIGKSRLVVEALGPAAHDEKQDLSRMVLYADSSVSDLGTIIHVVQTWTDMGARAIIVVDRCAPEAHESLANLIMRSGGRLSLITIDNEIPSNGPDDKTFVVSKASLALTEDVIGLRARGMDNDMLRRLARFADGYPGMAIRIREAWTGDCPVVHATEEHFVDTFVRGREPFESEFAIRTAQLFSVFGLVWHDEPSREQLVGIAGIDGSLTASDLRGGAQELIRRGVAQRRGRLVRIQPRPVAAVLAERQWGSWSRVDWDKVLSGLKPHGLRILAARQLVWLGETDISQEVVRHVCRHDGPFERLDGEAGAAHAEVLSRLAEIEPVAVVSLLERLLGAETDLLAIEGPTRRHLVWALERICFDRETFEEGADLMLRLAVAENEPGVANNATGQFCALFPILLGSTESDGEARLAFLREAAETDDPDQLGVVAEALVKATETRHFIRFGGSQKRGLRPDRVSWQPTETEESRQYFESCIDILARLCNRDDWVGVAARGGLGGHLRSLIGVGLIHVVERAVERVEERKTAWKSAIESLSQFLQYDSAKTERDTIDRVRRLLEKLEPEDLAHRARYLISDMPWHFPADEKLDIETRRDRQEEAIRGLAEEFVQRPDALREILPELCKGRHRMSALFGIYLAGLISDPLQWLEEISKATVDVHDDDRNFDVLSGYLKGLLERYPEVVERSKRTIALSEELAPALPLICWQQKVSAEDVKLVLDAFESGRLPAEQLTYWTIGGAISNLPTGIVSPLFDAMLDHSAAGFAVGLDLIGMYSFGNVDALEKLRPQVRKVAENVVRWEGAADGPMVGSHFEEIMQWMLAKGRKDADARSVALALSKALVGVSEVSSERLFAPLVPVLLADFPEICWPLIGNAIVSDESRMWRLHFVLGDRGFGVDARGRPILALPEETLFAWCAANPDVAPEFVAGIVPLLAPADCEGDPLSLHPIAERLLDEFGDRAGVVEAVEGNLNSFGWVGSVVPYFESYTGPLEKLRRHPKKTVRRWALKALRRVERRVENARNEDEKSEAFTES